MKQTFFDKAAKILPAAAIIIAMFGFFLIYRNKAQVTETVHLPYYGILAEQVEDGIYEAKTYTSYLHVQLRVHVQNHQITDIEVLENEGSKGQNVLPILQSVIEHNATKVPAVKGEEMASLVFISCIDSALKQGVREE